MVEKSRAFSSPDSGLLWAFECLPNEKGISDAVWGYGHKSRSSGLTIALDGCARTQAEGFAFSAGSETTRSRSANAVQATFVAGQ
jgi:hypothetical protein